MAFFRRLFNRQVTTDTKPAIRAETPLAFYIGGDGRIQAVKQSGILNSAYSSRVGLGYLIAHQEQYARAAIASVWAANCINLRADTMARLDWHVRNKKTKDIIDPHPFTVALENSNQNIVRLLEKRILTYGECFIKPKYNQYNYPSEFFVLNNLDVEVDTSRGYVASFMYNPQGVGRIYNYKPEDLIYIHTDNDFDDHRGLSKFEHVLLEIAIDRDISRTTAAFYRNDARPGVLLLPERDLTIEQGEEFIDYWNARFKGPDNAGRPAIIPNVIREVVDFQRAPALDDVELRESTRRETCAAFKVPLSMAGAWDDATYQSLPEQRQAFYEETIIPAAESNARDLTKHALPYFDNTGENEVYFDATKILSLVENVAEKVDVATRKLNSGAYTINEMRQSLDDDPIKGGDIHIMQSGWIPVRSNELASFEAPNTASPPEYNNAPMLPDSTDATEPTEEAPVQSIQITPKKSLKGYNPDQPRASNGQFGSGGGSSGGGHSSAGEGGSSGGSDKPKEGKPAWAKDPKRNAGLDDEGYLDLGNADNNKNPNNVIGRQNAEELSSQHISKLSSQQKASIKDYTGESYQDINNGLRGKGELTDSQRKTIDNIDKAMDQGALDRKRILYRSVKASPELRDQLKPGAEFSDAAYTSTSFDQYNNERFGGAAKDDIDFRIKAKEGQRGVAVSKISDYPEEHEFVLPRNTKYKITDVYVDPETGRTYVDAEIVG